MSSFLEAVSHEAMRAARSGSCFTLVRAAPAGWAALEDELAALTRLVSAHLRRTDVVMRVREREVGVLLIDAGAEQAHAPVQRIQLAAEMHLPRLEIRIGWAAVGPGQRRTWQEGWRWAGQLLVAHATVPAAA